VLLAGGLGGARLAPPLGREVGPGRLSVVANVGDDLDWQGVRVCPDLDSIAYALAGLWDGDRGWGRRDETFNVREGLERLGAATWFGVGDRDLALHLERTRLLRAGRSLTQASAELARRLGIRGVALLPASDRPSPTRLRLHDGRTLPFQEWYVREHAEPEVEETLLGGGPASAEALSAVDGADCVVFAPSNPLTSIGAILALEGMAAAVRRVPVRIAVSPVVLGRPSGSTAIAHHARAREQVMRAAGGEDRPASIAARYRDLADRFVLDLTDGSEAEEIRRLGLRVEPADVLDDGALARVLARLAAPSCARAGQTPNR
jgi:LPPG:FO 2-phospho-L-lactate transferase